MKRCLRRLGLAHTGPEHEDQVAVVGDAGVQSLVKQVLHHKRVTAVMDELQERSGADMRQLAFAMSFVSQ